MNSFLTKILNDATVEELERLIQLKKASTPAVYSKDNEIKEILKKTILKYKNPKIKQHGKF